MNECHYGYYSEKGAEVGGTCFYLTPEGKEVEVSCAGLDREGTGYMWPDKVFVGEITEYVRQGRKGIFDDSY